MRQSRAGYGKNRETDMFYEFAVKYMRIFMLMTFINGIQPVTSIGKANLGFWMSLTRQILLFVPLLLILPVFYGMEGVMWSGTVSDSAAAILAIIFAVREIRRMKSLEIQEGIVAKESRGGTS